MFADGIALTAIVLNLRPRSGVQAQRRSGPGAGRVQAQVQVERRPRCRWRFRPRCRSRPGAGRVQTQVQVELSQCAGGGPISIYFPRAPRDRPRQHTCPLPVPNNSTQSRATNPLRGRARHRTPREPHVKKKNNEQMPLRSITFPMESLEHAPPGK